MNRCVHSTVLAIASFIILAGCGPRKELSSHRNEPLEEKYSRVLDTDRRNIENISLYRFIDDWYGTPYRYGGKSKQGVDCSGFTSLLLSEIYGKNISGSSSSLYAQCMPTPVRKLKEGDLVFFKIESNKISHVGVYLQNNRFVHATTRAGVMINSLNEDYYRKFYCGAGSVR